MVSSLHWELLFEKNDSWIFLFMNILDDGCGVCASGCHNLFNSLNHGPHVSLRGSHKPSYANLCSSLLWLLEHCIIFSLFSFTCLFLFFLLSLYNSFCLLSGFVIESSTSGHSFHLLFITTREIFQKVIKFSNITIIIVLYSHDMRLLVKWL